jgi:AraC-like DNA-binding protein
MNAVRLANSVDFLSRTVDSPYSRRFSLDYRIGLVTRGTKKYTYRKRVLLADHNSIALAEPGEVHTGAPVREPFELRMLSLQPEALAEFVPQDCGYASALPSFDKPVFSDRELNNLLTGLFDGIGCGHDPECWKLYVDECLQSIVALLMARNTGLPHQEPPTRDRQAIQKAMSLIHDLYDRPLSLEEIARESGLPKYRFLRAFRAEVGLPPHRYQLHFRLEKAKRSIAMGTPLAEVALSSGFYDQSHFHRHFTGLTGISPHAYRLATAAAKPALTRGRPSPANT